MPIDAPFITTNHGISMCSPCEWMNEWGKCGICHLQESDWNWRASCAKIVCSLSNEWLGKTDMDMDMDTASKG